MHRSGTSLLTQWLYKCGLHVGDQFLGAGIGNKEGHYEDLDFFEYHKNVLRDLELSDDGMIHSPVSTLSDGQLHELRQLVKAKSSQQQWAWKEPRTCLFLPHYRQVLPDARYLVILRDYHSVVSSLVSRMYNRSDYKYSKKNSIEQFIWKYFKKPFRKKKLLKKYSEHYLRVWITYNQAILKHLQQLDVSQYLVVDQTSLSCNNQKVFEHLADKWDFSLKYYDYAKVYKEKLLSNVADIEQYVQDPILLVKAGVLQENLKAMAI
jgi:hypothetical protein